MGSNTSTPAVNAIGASQSLTPLVRRSAATLEENPLLDDEFSDDILHKVTGRVLELSQAPQLPAIGTAQGSRSGLVSGISSVHAVLTPNQAFGRGVAPVGGVRPRSGTHQLAVLRRSRLSLAGTNKINLFGLEPYDALDDQYNEVNEDMMHPEMDDQVVRNLLSPAEDVEMYDDGDDDWHRGKHIDEIDFSTIITPQSQPKAPEPAPPSVEEVPHNPVTPNDSLAPLAVLPVEIKWVNTAKEPIRTIAVIGLFTNWHETIPLLSKGANEYTTSLHLPLGVHKLLYLINNEYRVLDLLPTATDLEGIFFNWFEVIAGGDADAGRSQVDQIQRKLTSLLTKVSKETDQFEHIEYADPNDHEDKMDIDRNEKLVVQFHEKVTKPQRSQYLNQIPEMFVNYDYFKHKAPDYELPEPPQLPAHLNNVLLNKLNSNNHPPTKSHDAALGERPQLRRADLSYYALNNQLYHLLIPNHVILNHLMTTLIRNDVLTVACITRYLGKFITQIMHSPATMNDQN